MARDETRYWEEQHRTDDSLNAVGWAGLGRAFNGWMYAVRRRVFRRLVRAHVAIGPDSRVLDVGSGTGFYLDLWRELGAGRIEGSDMTENATRRLREARPGTPIHRADISDADQLPDGPYDVISAMDVLFHVTDDDAYERAIANLSGLLRPGGSLVMSENMLDDGRVHAGPVQVSRSEAEITRLLRAHGLEPVVRAPMFVLLNGPVDSRSRLLHRWWWLVTHVVSYRELLGQVVGAALMPFELAAVRIARRGPSTKLLICRRTGAA